MWLHNGNSYVDPETSGYEAGKTGRTRLKDRARELASQGLSRSQIKRELFKLIKNKEAGYVDIEGFDPNNDAQTNAILENMLEGLGMPKGEGGEEEKGGKPGEKQKPGAGGGDEFLRALGLSGSDLQGMSDADKDLIESSRDMYSKLDDDEKEGFLDWKKGVIAKRLAKSKAAAGGAPAAGGGGAPAGGGAPGEETPAEAGGAPGEEAPGGAQELDPAEVMSAYKQMRKDIGFTRKPTENELNALAEDLAGDAKDRGLDWDVNQVKDIISGKTGRTAQRGAPAAGGGAPTISDEEVQNIKDVIGEAKNSGVTEEELAQVVRDNGGATAEELAQAIDNSVANAGGGTPEAGGAPGEQAPAAGAAPGEQAPAAGGRRRRTDAQNLEARRQQREAAQARGEKLPRAVARNAPTREQASRNAAPMREALEKGRAKKAAAQASNPTPAEGATPASSGPRTSGGKNRRLNQTEIDDLLKSVKEGSTPEVKKPPAAGAAPAEKAPAAGAPAPRGGRGRGRSATKPSTEAGQPPAAGGGTETPAAQPAQRAPDDNKAMSNLRSNIDKKRDKVKAAREKAEKNNNFPAAEPPYGWHYNSSGYDYSEDDLDYSEESTTSIYSGIVMPEGWR
jgi:hypothetical protein